MVSQGFPSRRFPPSSSVNLIPSVSCSFRAAGGAMCSFRAAGGAMCAFRAAGGAMCAFRAAGGAMCAFRAAGGAMCAFRAAGGAMCAFRAAGGAMCSFRAAGGAMCAFRAAGGEMCLFRAAGGAMCLFRAAGGAICSFRAAGGAMCSFRAAGGAMCTFRAAGGAMCAFRAAGGAMCSFRAACGAMCAFRAAGAACCFFPDSRPFLPLYEERMTVAPPPASQPITDGHVAGQVGNGAARREAREVAEVCRTWPRRRTSTHLCSPALTSAPLRSPLLPALTSAPLRSPLLPALTSAPLHSPLLPCTHLCSPALTSAPLHSPLLFTHFSHHRFPSPTVHAIVSPSPTVHAIVSPSPNVHTTVSPSPVVHTTVFSPLFTHLCSLCSLCSPLCHPRLLAMLPALTCYAPSLPHSLIARNIQPEVAEHSSLLPCAHLCSPALTSAPLRSPLLPCAHLCSPALTSAPRALTSAPLRSPLLPCTHLCSPALTSAPLRSPLLPCAHLCSPALTSAPLRSPLLPCAHLCSPALTSAPLHSPLLPCTHLCSPALTSAPLHSPLLFTHFSHHRFPVPTVHAIVSPSPTVHAIVSPSRNVHTTVSPSPVVHDHGFFPTVHPPFVPSVPSVHPSAIPACSPCSPHSLAMLPPPTHSLPKTASQVWEREVEHVSGGELQRFAIGVVWEREVEHLSGGELQRFAIGVVAGQLGDIYIYVIVVERDLSVLDYLSHFIYVIVVEHDLSVLDYLSDFICCLYGKPGAYGVVTLPFSVREGINIFLAGFVPTENLRFRDESLTFRVSLPGRKPLVDNPEEGGQDVQSVRYRYLGMIKKHGGFNLLLPLPHSILSPPFIPSQVAETPVDNPEEAKTYTRGQDVHALQVPAHGQEAGRIQLTVEPGDFTDSQIVVMLGENGTGKTTFIRMLVGKLSLMACTSLWLSLLPVPSMIHLPSLLSPFQAALSRPDPDEETGKEAQGRPLEGRSRRGGPGKKLRTSRSSTCRTSRRRSAASSPSHTLSFLSFPLSCVLLNPLQAGLLKADPDEETGKEAEDLPEFNVSYKPQKISPKFPHSVRALLHSKIRDSFHHPAVQHRRAAPHADRPAPGPGGGEFVGSCPMQIDPLLDQEVVKISGGELQRVAITLCLGKVRKGVHQVPLGILRWSEAVLGRFWGGLGAVLGWFWGGFGTVLGRLRSCLMQIDPLLDQEVVNLSGGELQRMAISLCLGKPADIYLIDEPSAYLDSEQRIVAAKVIKRFILHAKKTAFVVEHDFIMATYLADRVIVYEGQPSVDCTARTEPQSLNSGMNLFLSVRDPLLLAVGSRPWIARLALLKSLNSGMNLFRHAQGSCALVGCTHGTPFSLPFSPLLATVPLTTIVSSHPQPPPPSPPQQLDITFRRDPTNFRPRINKMDSVKDREQKNAGTYYYLDD
ncbi:unnamed protein product [Closterium sp. NIES-65]|nr:unnamed protein product [Closterium sp. NIES-65]